MEIMEISAKTWYRTRDSISAKKNTPVLSKPGAGSKPNQSFPNGKKRWYHRPHYYLAILATLPVGFHLFQLYPSKKQHEMSEIITSHYHRRYTIPSIPSLQLYILNH